MPDAGAVDTIAPGHRAALAATSFVGNNTPPVVMLVFNRPELTRAVLDQIRPARPSVLLVVADGPRPGHPADGEKCAEGTLHH